MRDLVRKLLPYCLRHKGLYLAGILVVVVSNFCAVRSTVWTGKAVDYVLAAGASFAGIWHYVLWIGVFAGVASLGEYFHRILLIGVSREIEYEFRNDFFRHLTRLSPSFYDRMKTGDVISRATSDVDHVRQALGPGIMYPLNVLNLVPNTLVAMIAKNGVVTAICFVPMIVVPFLANTFSNLMYKRSLKVRENFSDFSGRIQDSIAGIRVVKSFVQGEHELEALDHYSKKHVTLNMSLAVLQAAFFPLMIPIFIAGVILIIWIGGGFVTTAAARPAGTNLMTKGDLIAFVLLYIRLFFPVMSLGWVLSIYQRASASMYRMLLIWNQEPEIKDGEETDRSLRKVRGEIEFRGLTFTYPKSTAPALRDVSLRIERGKTLGIVGPVGSGKSTVAQLIPRLYDAPPGALFIDGRDIRHYPLEVLRRSIGFVFQETYLFSESIEENILFGLNGGGGAASEGDGAQTTAGAIGEGGRLAAEARRLAEEAARLAAIDGEILDFPQQYRTHLGERGVNLSGGQKQRVSLARAIACDPPILILDDAFASVDTHTEEQILSGLRAVMRGRTTILISHRISTVKLADEIVVLDEGRIVERGSHDQLVALGGLYADINRRQLLEEAIAEENNTA